MTKRKGAGIMESENTQTSRVKLRPGMQPWKPGQSGNPGGRKPTPPDVKEALQAMLPHAVTRLGQLLMSDNEKIAIKAVEVVLDRNLGKAIATKIDVKADMGQMHLQLLEEIRARRQERLGQMVDVTPKGDTHNPYETATENVNKNNDPSVPD